MSRVEKEVKNWINLPHSRTTNLEEAFKSYDNRGKSFLMQLKNQYSDDKIFQHIIQIWSGHSPFYCGTEALFCKYSHSELL